MRFDRKIGSVRLATVRLATVTVATALALTLATVWSNEAWAQATSEPAQESIPLREEVRQAGLEAAAALLGMTPDELSDQLWGGESLADLAEEANVDLSAVRTAVEEATSVVRQERIAAFIAEQVENGRISQAQADWIMEGIDNDWFGLRRFLGRFDGLGANGFGLGDGRARMRLHERASEQAEEQSD